MMYETRGKFYNYKGNKKRATPSTRGVIDQGLKPHWFWCRRADQSQQLKQEITMIKYG